MGTKSSKQRKNRPKKSNLSPLSISQNNLHLTDCSYESNSLVGANSYNKAYNNSFSDSPLSKVKINHNKITNLLLFSSFDPALKSQKNKKRIKRSKISRVLYKNHNSILMFSLNVVNLMTEKLNKENNLHFYLTNNIQSEIGLLNYNISKSKFSFGKDRAKKAETLTNQYLDLEREENENRYQNYLINDMISTRKEEVSLNINSDSEMLNDKNINSIDEMKDEIKEFPIIKVKSVFIPRKKTQRKKITNKQNNKAINHIKYPNNININNINIKINRFNVYNDHSINVISSKGRCNKPKAKTQLNQKGLKRSETPVFKGKIDKYIGNITTNNNHKQKLDISQDSIKSFDQFSFGCHD